MASVTFKERLDSIKEQFAQPEWQCKFETAKAEGVDVGRYTQLMVRAIATAKTDKLMSATIASLCESLLESVSLGLPIGTPLGYGYIVPYAGKAQFQAGYAGLLKLAYNDGKATTAAAELVREGDVFDFEMGTRPWIKHKRGSLRSADRPIEWVYAIVHVVNGPPFMDVLPLADLDDHAEQYVRKNDRGDFYSDSLIVTNRPMWYRKTMLRKVLKFVPMSEVARIVLNREDNYDAGYIEPGDEEIENFAPQETRTLSGLANSRSLLDD